MKRMVATLVVAGMMILPTASAETMDVNLGSVAVGVGIGGGGAGTYEANCDLVLATSCSAAAGMGWGGCQTARGTIIVPGLADPEVEAEICITVVMTASAGAVWHLNPLTRGVAVQAEPVADFQMPAEQWQVPGVFCEGEMCEPGELCVDEMCSELSVVDAAAASKVKAEATATVYSEVPPNMDACQKAMTDAHNKEMDESGDRVKAIQAMEDTYRNHPACNPSIQESTSTNFTTCEETRFGLGKSCGAVASSHDDANVCGKGTAEVTSNPSVGETTEATGTGKTAACGEEMVAFLMEQQSSKSLDEASPEARRHLARHLDNALQSGLADIDEQGTAFCAQMEDAEHLCMEAHNRLLDELTDEIAKRVAAVAG